MPRVDLRDRVRDDRSRAALRRHAVRHARRARRHRGGRRADAARRRRRPGCQLVPQTDARRAENVPERRRARVRLDRDGRRRRSRRRPAQAARRRLRRDRRRRRLDPDELSRHPRQGRPPARRVHHRPVQPSPTTRRSCSAPAARAAASCSAISISRSIKCDIDLDGRTWNPDERGGMWATLPEAQPSDIKMGQRLWVLGYPDVGGGGLTLSRGRGRGLDRRGRRAGQGLHQDRRVDHARQLGRPGRRRSGPARRHRVRVPDEGHGDRVA